MQTSSTHNHIIERIWVELNKRVTYPVKRVVVSLDNRRVIDMDCPITKFSLSNVLMRVCEIGMNRMVQAWNNHFIPRRGIPKRLRLERSGTSRIHPSEVPSASTAVSTYASQGGRVTNPFSIGFDPLHNDTSLMQQREDQWISSCGMSVEDLFSNLISGNSLPLENAITAFIRITRVLSV